MRDATGKEVTGFAITGGALAGIAKGAVLSALCIGLPMYLWGDQIKPVFTAIVSWLGA